MTSTPQRILGVDPGLRFTGFGVVETAGAGRQARLIECGEIKTRAEQSLPERLQIIHDGIEAVVMRTHPDRMAFEQLVYCKNVQIALLLGQARAAAILAGAKLALPMSEYTPAEIKQAVVGRGRASKDQVQKMVRVLLAMNQPPESEHAADALAAALTYIHAKPVHDLLRGALKR